MGSRKSGVRGNSGNASAWSAAETVRRARKKARLTQVQLARRLGKSQTLVSQAETGAVLVGERYVRLVLAACDLPRSWGRPKGKRSGWDLEPHEIAGLDPETAEPVRIGSKRDKELTRLPHDRFDDGFAVFDDDIELDFPVLVLLAELGFGGADRLG